MDVSAQDPTKDYKCLAGVPKAVLVNSSGQFIGANGLVSISYAQLREAHKLNISQRLKWECEELKVCPVPGTNPPEYMSPEPAMMNYVCNSGPITAGVCSDTWNTYVSGVLSSNKSCLKTDHSVEVVGIDSSRQAWIIKNSWGSNFGATNLGKPINQSCSGVDCHGGYILLKYGVDTNGVASQAMAPPTVSLPGSLVPQLSMVV
jgi:hypothetical protein